MIRIMTDTAADYTIEDAKAKGITLIPLEINVDGTAYKDRFEMSIDDFYQALTTSDILPSTSQINPYTYEEYFAEAASAGDEAVLITLSSRLSGTYQSALIAAGNYDNVYVIDSLGVTISQKCLVDYACILRDKGYSAHDIASRVNSMTGNVRVLAILDTLEYLKKGGRISGATALAGSLLSIKPVVTVNDGEVVIAGKARGSKSGNNLLNRMIEECGGIDYTLPLHVAYSGNDSSLLDTYIEDSRDLWESNIKELPITRIGSSIGTHVGPGAIAVAFFQKRAPLGAQ